MGRNGEGTARAPRAAATALALAAAASLAAGCATTRRGSAAAGPEASGRRAFEIPGHGAIELAIPRGWTAEAKAGDDSGPPVIRLERPGAGFVALLTPFFDPAEGGAPSLDSAQLFTELARRNALAGAAEADIALQPLEGGEVRGFWFGATDRSLVGKDPGPNEWRHVVQGAAAVGRVVLAFTLLDNADGPQRQALLDVVRGARHLAAREGAAGADGMEPDPEARTVPLRVEVAGRPWAVLVDLPGFRMFKPRRSEDGQGVLVLGQDPDSGIVASVILQPARGARDAAGCRDADIASIRKATPGLAELRVAAEGPAARASYALARQGEPGPQRHGHAWLAREGFCANVHVSKIAPATGDDAAMEQILGSVRFGESL